MPHVETLRNIALFVLGAGLVVALCLIWYYPYANAERRGHPSSRAIFLLMILGLFTGVFWLVALVWSYFPTRPAALQLTPRAGHPVRCPTCNVAFQIPPEAIATRCPNCATFIDLEGDEDMPHSAAALGKLIAQSYPHGTRAQAQRGPTIARPPEPDVDDLLAQNEFERWRAQQRRSG